VSSVGDVLVVVVLPSLVVMAGSLVEFSSVVGVVAVLLSLKGGLS